VAYILMAVVAGAVFCFNGRVTLGVVFWTLVLALVVLLMVVLVRRPADEVAETTAEAATAEVAADAASDDEADTLVLAEGVVVDTGESTTPPASPSVPARRTD
jgi:Na+-transporting methylmalonyl-CoA/oxaloacetate decarboxylase gamma subunit